MLLVVLGVGMFIGFRKADFSYRWGENYYRNFGGPPGFFGDLGGRDFMDAHGVSGQIIKIDGQTLTIKGRDNTEKIVVIGNDTLIRRGSDTIKPSDLKVDDNIVVIGQPNNTGQIEAKLIRVMPYPLPFSDNGPNPVPSSTNPI